MNILVILGIEGEAEQQEILSLALDVGYPTTDLCKEVYQRFKKKCPIEGDNDEVNHVYSVRL